MRWKVNRQLKWKILSKTQFMLMELLRQLALQQIRTLESVSTDKLPRLR